MVEASTWSSLARTRAAPTLALAGIGAAGLFIWRTPLTAGVFLACALATWMLVPRIARWAMRRRVLALPGGRDRHARRTPRAGGIALFIPVAVILLAMGILGGETRAWGLLAGSAIVFLCGLADDVRGVRPLVKVLCQIAAGGVLLLAGFELPTLSVPGLGTLALGWFEVPLLLFWVVLACNALNLSDGLDGLAASLTMLGLAVFVAGDERSLAIVALAGTCLGFLHYNMPRARIFLGDSGSLLLGFLLAAFALLLPAHHNLPMAIGALAYPLGDVALAVMRRFVRGKPLFAPDASHVHHKALAYLGSPRRAWFAVLAFATLHATFAVLWPGVISITLSAALWFFTALMLVRLANLRPAEVLDDRKPLRRLHRLRRYVGLRIDEARSERELRRALEVFVEGAGVCALTLGRLEITHPDGCCRHARPDDPRHGSTPCVVHDVRMMVGHASWRAPDEVRRDVVRRERETIVVGILRRAQARRAALRAMDDALESIDALAETR